MNQKELYLWAKKELEKEQVQEPSIKARRLMEFVLKQTRSQMISNELEEVSLEKQKEYAMQIEKIKKGMPIQYITHRQEFMGLEFYVDENVLIPQPDTEIVVETAIRLINNKLNFLYKTSIHIAEKFSNTKQKLKGKEMMQNNELCILDLCTGSGCIGISIAKNLDANNIDNANIVLSDIQEKALKIAQKNAIQNKVQDKVKIIQSDLFETLPKNEFAIIVSNPPYIETNQIARLSKEVQQEPKIALDGGEDGLLFYRKILEEAHFYLKTNGYLVLEIGYNQANSVLTIAEQTKKWKTVTLQAIQDLGGNDRVLVFQKENENIG